jgi:hypothetical protein
MEDADIHCRYGVPCVHHKRLNIKDSCHRYYNVEIFRKAYNEVAHPLPEEDLDP